MENVNIESWDLRGWMGVIEPTPDAQRNWNKTLIDKINLVSENISNGSMVGGADTIVINPYVELILHPELYDDFRKKLSNNISVVLDHNVDKDRIEVKNEKILEGLKEIPFKNEDGSIVFRPLEECSEEEIVSHISSLIGYIVIENI